MNLRKACLRSIFRDNGIRQRVWYLMNLVTVVREAK